MLKCYLTFFPEDDNRKGSLSNMFVNPTRTRDRPAWQSAVAMHYSLYNDHRHGDDDDDVTGMVMVAMKRVALLSAS